MKQNFRDAFLSALERSGRSLREVATSAGVSYDQLKKLKQGQSGSTNVDDAIAIAAELHFSLGTLAPIESAQSSTPVPTDAGTMIDVYDIRASAGHGAVIESEEVIERLSFPPGYLERITRTHPRHLKIIGVKGDSMEPTLKDDDVVMLDTTKTSLDFDGLFVLRWGDALHVKRVGRASNGSVSIISDNKSIYPPIEMARSEVEVIGKVIWMGKRA